VNRGPPNDDALEDRLRETLRRPGPDHLDPDRVLRSVHSRARSRRTRRLAAASVAVVALAGGGIAALSGHLGSSGSQLAGQPASAPVTTAAAGLPASEAVPVSLTATGTDYQWVLTALDDGSCASTNCAVVYGTADAGASWSAPHRLRVPVIGAGARAASPQTGAVSQIRFSRAADGGPANGWAYGGDLLSTHDSGERWNAVHLPVGGQVTYLEAFGDEVYATVDTGSGVVLVMSPADHDAWSIVDNGIAMTSVSAVAATRDDLALITTTGDNGAPHVVVTADGATWSVTSPCPSTAPATQLSASSDPTSGRDGVWVVCSSPGRSTTVVVSLDAGIHWRAVAAPEGSFTLAARSADSAIAVDDGTVVSLRRGSEPTAVSAVPVHGVVFAGFTNPDTGYVIGADGRMWRSGDGGRTWSAYAVSP
jgi:hypothetical protein